MTDVTILGRWDDVAPAWLESLWDHGISLEDCCDAEVPGQFNPEPVFPGTIPTPRIVASVPGVCSLGEFYVYGCYRKAGHAGRHFGVVAAENRGLKDSEYLAVWGRKLPSHLQRLDAQLRRDFHFAAEPWQLEIVHNALQNPGQPVRLVRSRTYDYAKGLTL